MTKISTAGRALFIFRRDLRIEDNTALNLALSQGYSVVPVFIVDPRQFDPHPYRSEPGIQFLIESLQDLDLQLRGCNSQLNIVRGTAEDLVIDLLRESACNALFFNRDYTPFSRRRDARLTERAQAAGVNVQVCDDTLIDAPGTVVKDDGKPYTVFTPYYKRALKRTAPKPESRAQGSFVSQPLPRAIEATELARAGNWDHLETIRGGRNNGLKALNQLAKHAAYDQERDFPALPGTTRLSAHHKFGTISIRETYDRSVKLFGRDCTLIRELYWRDFFTQIAFHFPHVFEGAFNRAYDRIEWHSDPQLWRAWCEGNTGFPIVDAGMRELNQTGNMHNRVRMIVASFLTKDLHIGWRDGERYFAQKLIDYDPAVNNGSWQWASSSGCDAQPYFRIFNPWLQQEKFDSDCAYIKRWIPELRSLSSRDIHALHDKRPLFLNDYPHPVVDHAREKRTTEELYARALKG